MSHVKLEYLPPPLDGPRGKPALVHGLLTSEDGSKPYGPEENLISD
jgi:hypothetical protein